MRIALIVSIAIVLCTGNAPALPRYTLLTGTRCSACHFNPQGSGIRNELGWSTMNQVGAIKPESIGLGALYSNETNGFFDGLLTFGFDGRVQYLRQGLETDPYKFLVMQVSPAVALAPTDWLTAYGSYNFADVGYPGQGTWDAAVQIQPGITLPLLRAGFIQPSIGIRNDDHTMYTRFDAAGNSSPLIPPNYNEIGAEVTYEGQRWITLNAGVFSSHNLAQKFELHIDSTKPEYSARVILWPQLLDEGLNGMVGGSFYGNSEFRMINGFAGIGLSEQATLYSEAMFSKRSDGTNIRNITVQGSYQLEPWLALEGRYETGFTDHPELGPLHSKSIVVGTQFFPIPYLEFRPEYRYIENDFYSTGQFTVQLHAFY